MFKLIALLFKLPFMIILVPLNALLKLFEPKQRVLVIEAYKEGGKELWYLDNEKKAIPGSFVEIKWKNSYDETHSGIGKVLKVKEMREDQIKKEGIKKLKSISKVFSWEEQQKYIYISKKGLWHTSDQYIDLFDR